MGHRVRLERNLIDKFIKLDYTDANKYNKDETENHGCNCNAPSRQQVHRTLTAQPSRQSSSQLPMLLLQPILTRYVHNHLCRKMDMM